MRQECESGERERKEKRRRAKENENEIKFEIFSSRDEGWQAVLWDDEGEI